MFSEFYGNSAAKKFLTNVILNKTFSHAYLFLGEHGIGCSTLAKLFAKKILCKNNFKNCNCSSCLKFNSGSHPDFFTIEQDLNNSTQSFNIDFVRNLKNIAQIKPNESSFKIFLLKQVSSLNLPTANSLLKILEEPPENTIFLLTAENLFSVLPTISSRCQLIKLTPLNFNECFNILKLKFKNIEDFEIKKAIAASSCKLETAISILKNPKEQQFLKIAELMLKSILSNDEASFLKLSIDLDFNKKQIHLIFSYVLSLAQNIILDQIKNNKASEKLFLNLLNASDNFSAALSKINANCNFNLTIANLSHSLFNNKKS